MYVDQSGPSLWRMRAVCRALAGGLMLGFSVAGQAALTIEQAQKMAISSDAGIRQVLQSAEAMKSDAVAKSQLPDPVLILGGQNLPTDSFKFDQEPMTQLRVGIRQMFPQGDSLSLMEDKMSLQAEAMYSNAEVRYLQVNRNVRGIWLEVMYWQQALQVLEQDQKLFEQLLDVTRSLYSVGRIQQTDVLRAELELSRLNEKLIKAGKSQQKQRIRLSRWIGEQAFVDWPEQMPLLNLPDIIDSRQVSAAPRALPEPLARKLREHPLLMTMDRQVAEAEVDVALAENQYDPAWGVELSYGYRDGQNPDGSDRSDFFSAVVTVSMPIFSSVKQDQGVRSSNYRQKSRMYAVDDQFRQMNGDVAELLTRLNQTEEQLTLFRSEIISKSRQQAEAALSAYQSDASGFGEVMRSYLSEQKDRLDYRRLLVDRLLAISELQYFFPSQTSDLTQKFSELNNQQGESFK